MGNNLFKLKGKFYTEREIWSHIDDTHAVAAEPMISMKVEPHLV